MRINGESYDIPQDNDPKNRWIGLVILIEFIAAMAMVLWILT